MAWQPTPRRSQADARRLRGTLTGAADAGTVGAAPVDPRVMPADEPAAQPASRGNFGSSLLRGLGSFFGYVPKGGARGDTPELIADIGRGLLGERSIRDVETEANQRRMPEDVRRAVEGGAEDNFAALERLDPERAMNLRRARQADEQQRAAAEREAELQPKRELARTAFAIARETGMPFGQAIQMIEQDIGREVFAPQERLAAEAGSYPGLLAALGEEDPYGSLFRNMGGNTVLDLSGGSVTGPGFIQRPQTEAERDDLLSKIEERAARAAADGQRADAAMLNAQANYLRAQKYQPGGGADTTAEGKSAFSDSLSGLGNIIADLADAGAIGTGGRGGSMLSYLGAGAGREGLGGTIADAATLANIGSAPIFTARNTQVDLAIRQFAQAAGIKTGALNSNFELQNVKNALGNPMAPLEVQIAALDAMAGAYGDGRSIGEELFRSGRIDGQVYGDIVRRTQGFQRDIEVGIGKLGDGDFTSPRNRDGGQGDLPTLTVEQAATAPSGTRFRGTDGNIYTKP